MAGIKVLSTNAFTGALRELIPSFERDTGPQVTLSSNTTAQIMERLGAGEAGDVVIGTVAGLDQLVEDGKAQGGQRARLGSATVGLGVRKGAPKPDISTPAKLKNALLAAKSITYTTLGQSGVHFEDVARRLGIFDELKPRFKVILGGLVGELVVRGEAEVGVQMLTEIYAVEGFELVAPFPAELQLATHFGAAVLTASIEKEAAAAFVRMLGSPPALAVLRAKGFEISSS
jgi:molybdate transport system substrate-binding protein